MKTVVRAWRAVRPLAVVAAAALVATACSIDKQSAPALTGPSEFGLSVTLKASPDLLTRDGSSQSMVMISVRDASGQPVNGQRLTLYTTAGTLSDSQVTTGANGGAVLQFIAPPASTPATDATITAVPVGSNFDNAVGHTVRIGLVGAAIPVPSFVASSIAPKAFDTVSFDAAATTVGGQACPETVCTYTFDFGDTTTATGIRVSKRFTAVGRYAVTLTVTTPDGTFASTTTAITVGAPAALTPVISFSPTDPTASSRIFFDGRGSTTPDGVSIVGYEWDFGNGQRASGATPDPVTYGTAQTFVVRLTVTDALGRTGTTTVSVSVKP
jgi:PKD repeat protein